MLTKEEWQRVEQVCKSFYGHAKLNIDGYEITIQLRRITTYRNAIVAYINGKVEFKWLIDDCEERRRFMQRKERSLLNAKDRKLMKGLPKKRQKELEEKSKYESYDIRWTSFTALKRHLVANNEEIELIEVIGD